MENEISKIDFDIAIIGCGAYGLPLAAHVKRMGKKVVHMGGATQLLFGIKGKRWEDSNFKFINKYWVRPLEEEKPKDHKKVEDSCYW
jgi:ketopantoate reductase